MATDVTRAGDPDPPPMSGAMKSCTDDRDGRPVAGPGGSGPGDQRPNVLRTSTNTYFHDADGVLTHARVADGGQVRIITYDTGPGGEGPGGPGPSPVRWDPVGAAGAAGGYHDGCNPALLRAVPATARRILDVGCASGRFGAALKAGRPDRVVCGVESRPEVAARAATRLDAVYALDVEAAEVPEEAGPFDCIAYGDVLEHLRDPESVLRRHRRLLAAGGRVVASVPNAQHHTLVAALLTGDFQYTDAGLLDRTHLRFFTLSTAFKLLLDAGYAPDLAETIGGGPRGRGCRGRWSRWCSGWAWTRCARRGG